MPSKNIEILNEFGVYDLSDEDQVQFILSKLELAGHSDLTLDLSGCLPDYPVTSILIDRILSKLKSGQNEKTLTILIEFDLPKEILVNWLFLGSKELGIVYEKSLSFEEIKSFIQRNAINKGVTIVIKLKDVYSGVINNEIKFE